MMKLCQIADTFCKPLFDLRQGRPANMKPSVLAFVRCGRHAVVTSHRNDPGDVENISSSLSDASDGEGKLRRLWIHCC